MKDGREMGCRERRKEKKIREECFLQNGRLLLEKLITSFNSKSNPIRTFYKLQLSKATNDYSSSTMFCDQFDRKWYKGCLEGRLISVGRFNDYSEDSSAYERVIMDIGIGAQMGVHKNALKLIGCCLETSPPTPVYEFPINGYRLLSHRISQASINESQPQPLPWKNRLRIGVEIAHVISYLHLAFPTPIIHRDIKPENFFLGQDCSPKLCSFLLAIPIPKGETHVVDAVRGTMGCIAPEYLSTGTVTEKADVFASGILLLQLLTGIKVIDFARSAEDEDVWLLDHVKKQIKNKENLNGVVDPNMVAVGVEIHEWQQMKQILGLALLCTRVSAEERPTMLDVAKHLKQIQRGEVIHVESNHQESTSLGITLFYAGVPLHKQENLNSNSFKDSLNMMNSSNHSQENLNFNSLRNSPNLIDFPDFQETR